MMLTLVIAALCLAFAALCVLSLPLAVVVFCGLLPTYLFRFNVPLPGFSLPTTCLEILFLILAVVWLATGRWRAAALPPLGRDPAFFKTNIGGGALFSRWAAPLLLFLVAGFIGIAVSPDLRAALGLFRAYLLEPVVFFFIASTELANPRLRRFSLYALGASLAILGVAAVYQKITGYGIPLVWQPAAVRRVTSFFAFPNALGLFAAPVSALMAGLTAHFAFTERKYRRLYALLPLAVFLLGALSIVFAVSKGAALGLAAGLAVFGLLYRPLRAPTLVAIIAVCAVVVSVAPVLNWFAVRADLRDQSGAVRQIVWRESWSMLQEHPVFGAGLSGYPETIAPYHEASYIEIFQYPHDLFLNFWSEMGLAGLAGFGWIVILTVMYAARRLRNPEEGWLAAAVIAALAAILVHGLVDVPYFKNDLAMMFWLLPALVASKTRRPAAAAPVPPAMK